MDNSSNIKYTQVESERVGGLKYNLKNSKGWGGAGCSGCLFFVIGGLLCMTGIGAIIGAPMIIAGVVFPLVFPFLHRTILRGDCPWCGTKVISEQSVMKKIPTPLGVKCPACKHRLVIRDGKFLKIE